MPTHQHFGGQAALALYIHDTGEGKFGELELRLGRQLMKTRLGWLCVSVRIIRSCAIDDKQTVNYKARASKNTYVMMFGMQKQTAICYTSIYSRVR